MDHIILDLGSDLNVILKQTWENDGQVEAAMFSHSVNIVKSL
jgi:hypothetical protein